MGFTFALFYTFFGIPLGRLADSRSRRTIIAVGVAVWSIMTAGCGLARNFTQMLLLRVGVGVGEGLGVTVGVGVGLGAMPPAAV
jgi:MFS family permease